MVFCFYFFSYQCLLLVYGLISNVAGILQVQFVFIRESNGIARTNVNFRLQYYAFQATFTSSFKFLRATGPQRNSKKVYVFLFSTKHNFIQKSTAALPPKFNPFSCINVNFTYAPWKICLAWRAVKPRSNTNYTFPVLQIFANANLYNNFLVL